ncbi:Anti-sigma regulatory factor (Ser/Thr protein kinase) [Thermomonospora echinospora]|uniref:Anti-sigma regulatory factor (Ser/Thr protein kinase) n=1 Tax=Thermomonospora echinospora TaxID=1992 RepID=A0A1H6B632_9ACTN|nr:ATP-binding protein [Thermomonospora echinospora]SEG55855.1 Anti-sigma regulatory factor (Ser/Thr protein kinase) [Thermomonospora echinospora]
MKTSPDITEPAVGRARTAVPDTAEDVEAGVEAKAAVAGDGPWRRPPGWAWTLPGGPACAREARTVLGQALGALGAPADLIADAQLMVSELATNAYQHAPDQGPYELWLYPHGPQGPGRELRCAIFDGLPDTRLPGYSWTSGDCGRGLSIVRELSGERWGMCRDRSRFGDHPPGKAVWFALPSPVHCPPHFEP